ncbi:UdgX family uracil-DNA binding protein [Mycobacterium sp. 21AC1]|uniref:UdgX family uracil-DNA binding protein n=1 Tax=[Mycobacterium] appelbergii TaxID=2939269 RepID=UPI002939141C|nr:UdgX family uracil-DNA binding protein [Mycobacterium sp. 21AC1]MDV3128533.1 UdgX family uracil-DNA binding protein [Mycobacterium sp. 21AC1]
MAGAQEYVPPTLKLDALASAADECRGCDLYRDATQTVFGAGRRDARMMLIGEQPGDREDRAGLPFVGPAGRVLDKALEAAGIDREGLYLTNAVKHFKFSRAEGSKRRIHKTPSRTEMVACRPWLFTELAAVEPDVVVLLGAVAAKSLFGSDFRVTRHRGEVLHLPAFNTAVATLDPLDPAVVATVHPSSLLRGPKEDRDSAFAGLVADLRRAGSLCKAPA